MKLAIGPAATMAARLRSGWPASVESPLLLRHRRHALEVGRARRMGVAVELDVTANRKGGEPPAGAVAIDPGEDFRAKTQRKGVDLDPAPASDEVMAKLVNEDDQADYEDEGQDIPPHPNDGGVQVLQNRHSELSDDGSPAGDARPSWLPIGIR